MNISMKLALNNNTITVGELINNSYPSAILYSRINFIKNLFQKRMKYGNLGRK